MFGNMSPSKRSNIAVNACQRRPAPGYSTSVACESRRPGDRARGTVRTLFRTVTRVKTRMEYTTGSRIIDDVQPMRDLDVTRSSRDNGVRTFDEVKKKIPVQIKTSVIKRVKR